MFLVQLRNEFVKLFARRRTYIGFGVFCLVEIVILLLLSLPPVKEAFLKLMANNGLNFEDTYHGLGIALSVIYLTVNLLGVLYLALVSAEMVAREVEDGTMRMILARPVSRARVLALKIIVNMVHTAVFVAVIGAISLLVALVWRQSLGNLLVFAYVEGVFSFFGPEEGLWRYVQGLLVLGLSLQMVSGLGFLFSCFRLKPATATVLTASVLFADMILRGIPYFEPIRHFFLSHHLACWVLTFRHVVPWTEVAESLCWLLALTVSCWVIGSAYFCTRDFKP